MILYQSSNKPMVPGDVFSPKEKLIFKTYDSRAAVINPERGRFLITPPNSGTLSGHANFIPAMSNLSPRDINEVMKLKGRFLILKEVRLKINTSIYPMNDTAFFYLKFLYKSEEINKKLGFEADELILNRDQLLKVDNFPISDSFITGMNLFYLSGSISIFLSEFIPVFPQMKDLGREISIIKNSLKGKDSDIKLLQIMSYLNEFYGLPDENDVRDYLKLE